MSWHHVFRRDLKSGMRSRNLHAVSLLLFIMTFGIVGLMAFFADPRYPPPMEAAVMILGAVISFIVPLAALLSSYTAIVGERTTGSVRFLLGLPNSRGDVYVGKFLSRSVTVVAPLMVGMTLSGVVVATSFDNGAFLPLVGLGVLGSIYAMLFVAMAMFASAYASSENRAVSLVIGIFVVLRVGWPAAQWVGLQSLEEQLPHPEWYFWFGRLNPINAFVKLTELFADTGDHPLITSPQRGAMPGEPFTSFAVSMEFAAIVLAVFTIVTPIAGFVYFRQRDML